MSTLKNKIAGAVYGAAIGDAMGATTELMFKKDIEKELGKVTSILGGGWLGLKKGQVTDDTQMSICVMQALMNQDKKDFIEGCKENFIDWYNSCPPDVGGQCSKGIKELIKGKVVKYKPGALGNGSLMRALPCALINDVKKNIAQGNLTHNNKTCSNIIEDFTNTIHGYLMGDKNFSSKVKVEHLMNPTGCVVNSYNNALYYVSNFNNFEDAMISCVNEGGDADTIGSIAGALLGAKFGLESIPKDWIDSLDNEIKKVLDTFIKYVLDYVA